MGRQTSEHVPRGLGIAPRDLDPGLPGLTGGPLPAGSTQSGCRCRGPWLGGAVHSCLHAAPARHPGRYLNRKRGRQPPAICGRFVEWL